MLYKMEAILTRTVQERFRVDIEASSRDEALDLAYSVLEDYPDSDLTVNRLLCLDRENIDTPVVEALFIEGDASNDAEEFEDEPA